MENLTLEQIKSLLTEAGIGITAIEASFLQINASNEGQYLVTHFSNVFDKNVTNHAFVDYDIDGDMRIRMNDLEPGDLNERRGSPQDAEN